MQAASPTYKAVMKQRWKDRLSFIRVTLGLINQPAQANAFVPQASNYTYYSNLKWPLDNYQVRELYATCDQDYSLADGNLYFLPRNRSDVVLNAGIVSSGLLGSIEVQFPVPYDIKGLTVEFGKAYPTDFVIESDHNTVKITGNSSGHFVTQEIFGGTTFLRFKPSVMINGQSRFRIHQLTMGIGIYFDNQQILSATKKEHISPIMEELPSIDFDLTINNKNRTFDIENEESTVNFLEIGQDVKVIYGQELESGEIEWMPGVTVKLKEWSADDNQMQFSASDRFDGMDGTYYRGQYRSEGISLYELAVDVFNDAGIDHRTYWIDNYLMDVKVCNPMPVVPHKEALQLIANAGRCILYQDRDGNIFFKSSFVPDMTAGSDNETYFSRADAVLDKKEKMSYAMAAKDFTDIKSAQYFLPKQNTGVSYLNTGYVSEAVADGQGKFHANPTVEISLEARYKCFGLTLEFGKNHPEAMVFHAYLAGELQEDYQVAGLTTVTVVSHEFPEFDRLVLEFIKGSTNNRVVLNHIVFGDSTDYVLEYGTELTKTPKGTQLPKVRELQVVRTLYGESQEPAKELAKEIITVTEIENRYIFYFSNPSYGLNASITEPKAGERVTVIKSSSYYAMVELTGVTGAVEVVITGQEYEVTQSRISRQLNPTGNLEIWENPLVSDVIHATDMADWIGDFLKADREYDLQYRGEPRMDANDIAFLENKYVPDLLLRIYDHTLKFNGALSGTIKARRDISYVATAKNKLES